MTDTLTPAQVKTRDLRPGDVLLMPNGAIRTVHRVGHSGYVNARGRTIYTVWYVEAGDDMWSGTGNSGVADSLWSVLARVAPADDRRRARRRAR